MAEPSTYKKGITVNPPSGIYSDPVVRGATGGAWHVVRNKAQKKRATRVARFKNLVRTKGLEPPRLSASDPKSDVATNYTMSAGSLTQNYSLVLVSGAKIKTFYNICNFIYDFLENFSYFCVLNMLYCPSG